MNQYNLLYFVYGLCVMFHIMMACMFLYRQKAVLKRLVAILMTFVACQYIKDMAFMQGSYYSSEATYFMSNSLDLITVPLYVLVLVEACRPHWLNWRRIVRVMAPFVALPLVYMVTQKAVFFYAMVVMAGTYGIGCAIWTLYELPVYHRRLKEEYSYDEDINLHWLQGVMVLFFIILITWICSYFDIRQKTDIVYMLVSLVGWAVTCYFFYRQDQVFKRVTGGDLILGAASRQYADSANENNGDANEAPAVDTIDADVQQLEVQAAATAEGNSTPSIDDLRNDVLEQRIRKMFDDDKVYLNPKLRLTDLAQTIGTNRTYLSNYFNRSCYQSFYDYVNDYRINHAKTLLTTTDYTLEVVATMAGFNSLSTFRRAFTQRCGCSPQAYRDEF